MAKKARKAGRPSKYQKKFADEAERLCKAFGATDVELAEYFKVSEKTINNWKEQYPEFVSALKSGKDAADSEVIERLYQRAIGYTHPEEKIFCQNGEVIRAKTTKHYPPDTTACIFWLKNRQPDDWRDRQEVTGAGGGPLTVELVKFGS